MTAAGAIGLVRKKDFDGLRGVAVLMTIFLHYVCRSGLFDLAGPKRFVLLLDSTWSGVDIFFVLSGFLIGGIIIDNGNAENFFRVFYLRRALQILPVAWLTILFSYFILPLLNPSIRWHVEVPPYAYLLLINNLWTAFGHFPYPPLGPMWSLAIEEQFYLFAPVLLLSVGPRVRNAALIVVVVMSPLLRVADLAPSGWDFTLFRLDGFAMGIQIAVLLRDARTREFAVRHREGSRPQALDWSLPPCSLSAAHTSRLRNGWPLAFHSTPWPSGQSFLCFRSILKAASPRLYPDHGWSLPGGIPILST